LSDLQVQRVDDAGAARATPLERRLRPDPLLGTAATITEPRLALHSARFRLVTPLLVVDVLAVVLAMVVAYLGRFGQTSAELSGAAGLGPAGSVNYVVVSLAVGGLWLGALALQRTYEARFLGVGSEEYKRVMLATFQVFGALAILCYSVKIDLARGFIALAAPTGLVLLLGGRFLNRLRLKKLRATGVLCHRVVVVGDRVSVMDFTAQVRREPAAGFTVVGACLPTGTAGMRETDGLHVLGDFTDIAAVADVVAADVVAVTASEAVTPALLRKLAWSLEGTRIDLVVAPPVTDVSGPRLTMRPVAGLPLLYLDEPRFTGFQRVLKGSIDLVAAAVGLLLLAPLLLGMGLVIRWTSPGPAVFRQVRVGRGGREFTVWKFRTMFVDAGQRLEALRRENEGDGLLFKIKEDPRITPVGRWLRRTSLDELPQLVNVLLGQMSLVGPRPLAVDSGAFLDHEHRRHLVKPGMTGLWQVSGREDQLWADAVRLDLYYVENWSLALDVAIVLRTVVAVVRGSGA